MGHQPREEKPDQKGWLQIEFVLVMRGSLSKRQEEQKAANKERWVMSHHDRPSHEQELHDRDPNRNRRSIVRSRSHTRIRLHALLHQREFFPENIVVDQRRSHNAHQGFPTKMGEHEDHVPIPGASHHQHRRRRKMRKRSTHRNIYEQQANGRVSEATRRLQFIKLSRQQQS